MIHPLHERYARLLVDYCTSVKQGDRVIVSLDVAALDLGRAIYREVLRAGGEPFLRVSYPEQSADFIELATDPLLASEPAMQLAEIRNADAFIRVIASDNATALAGLDTSRLGDKRLAEVNRIRVEKTRWALTLYPTPAAAQAARMSTEAYERFVYGAMFLDDPDPAARWRELGATQQRLVDRLNTASDVHLTGPGTDLRLRVTGRSWASETVVPLRTSARPMLLRPRATRSGSPPVRFDSTTRRARSIPSSLRPSTAISRNESKRSQ